MLDLYQNSDYLPSESEVIQAAMKWHFDSQTGSDYWLEKSALLEFDPLADINTFADLTLFDDVSKDWKTVPAQKLIPRGFSSQLGDFFVFESGGTTGNPKRIIENLSRKHALRHVQESLLDCGFDPESNHHWLHVGPSGPHIVGRTMKELASKNNRFCYYIDFDPRWVKKLILKGKSQEVDLYKEHLLQQALDIVESQDISVMFVTPPLLESICKDAKLLEAFRKKIKVILWAGTSMSQETYSLITTIYFPDVVFMGLYGNTMMGIAPQRKANSDDIDFCIYQPAYPFCNVRFVDPSDGVDTEYDEYGQICVSLLTPEIFIPNNIERDYAKRIRPLPGTDVDGIADVGPIPNNETAAVEGVY